MLVLRDGVLHAWALGGDVGRGVQSAKVACTLAGHTAVAGQGVSSMHAADPGGWTSLIPDA